MTYYIKIRFIFLASILAFLGCTAKEQDISIILDNYPNNFEYVEYINGSIGNWKHINSDDEIYKKVHDWLTDNHKGWKASFVTYVPNILMSSSFVKINILPSLVVINYSNDEGATWHQIVRAADENILD